MSISLSARALFLGVTLLCTSSLAVSQALPAVNDTWKSVTAETRLAACTYYYMPITHQAVIQAHVAKEGLSMATLAKAFEALRSSHYALVIARATIRSRGTEQAALSSGMSLSDQTRSRPLQFQERVWACKGILDQTLASAPRLNGADERFVEQAAHAAFMRLASIALDPEFSREAYEGAAK